MSSAFWLGRRAERRFVITGDLVDRFAALSGDTSGIHMSAGVAATYGFRGRVVHGFLLGAFVSALVGTELPGESGVLQSVRLEFRQPCLAEESVLVELLVTDVFESVRTLEMSVRITGDAGVLVTGRVRSGIRESNA